MFVRVLGSRLSSHKTYARNPSNFPFRFNSIQYVVIIKYSVFPYILLSLNKFLNFHFRMRKKIWWKSAWEEMHTIRAGLGRNNWQQRIINDNSYLFFYLSLTGKASTHALSSFFLLLFLLPKNWGRGEQGRLVVQGRSELGRLVQGRYYSIPFGVMC